VKPQHHPPRNLPAGSRLRAHAAFSAALDRLLDPLENLRQEDFQSEAVQATETEAATGVARLPNFGRLSWWLRVLLIRMCYSKRPPYRQIRAGVFQCFVLMGVFAILWLLAQ
jgi:hypothetical protein